LSERVGGEDVEAFVAGQCGRAGDRVKGPLDIGTNMLFGLAPTSWCDSELGGPGEIEQVGALRVVELQRSRERVEHAVRDPVHVAPFDPGVVRDADTGQDGHLGAAQAGDPAVPVCRQPSLVGGDPSAARGEELADLFPGVHG